MLKIYLTLRFRRGRNIDLSNLTLESQGSDRVLRNWLWSSTEPRVGNLECELLDSTEKHHLPSPNLPFERFAFLREIYFRWQESTVMVTSCIWTTLRIWEKLIGLVGSCLTQKPSFAWSGHHVKDKAIRWARLPSADTTLLHRRICCPFLHRQIK